MNVPVDLCLPVSASHVKSGLLFLASSAVDGGEFSTLFLPTNVVNSNTRYQVPDTSYHLVENNRSDRKREYL